MDDKEVILSGLTPQQAHLLEIMWNIKDVDEFEHWYLGLPKKTRRMVDNLKYMLVLEILESHLETDEWSKDVADRLLDQLRGNG